MFIYRVSVLITIDDVVVLLEFVIITEYLHKVLVVIPLMKTFRALAA